MSILTADPTTTTAAVDYCRRARRIRANFSRNPFMRHHALRDLARQRNLELLVNSRLAAVPKGRSSHVELRPFGTAAKREFSHNHPAYESEPTQFATENPNATENEFAVEVAAKLQPFGFGFTDRIKLLDSAERMGISRFRANVILAMHEHRTVRVSVPSQSKPFAPSMMAILAVEAAVVCLLVWICTL